MENSLRLTDKQSAVLKQFREAVRDCNLKDDGDAFLLKWLVARDFDLGKAEKMLRTSLEWRRKFRVDELTSDWKPPDVMKRYFPVGLSGHDKFGCPLWVVAYGRGDIRGLLHSVRKRDYLLYVLWIVENSLREMESSRRKTGVSVTQQTIVFDLEQFSMRHVTHRPSMDSAIQLVQIYEANYPEMLRRVFVVNAPKVFTIAFSMLKPFLHEVTLRKISIFGSDQQQWKAAILKEVDPDQLPVHYGGTQTDPDGNPMCPSKICMGGEVPKSLYLSNSRSEAKNELKSLTVASGSSQKLEFNVTKPGSALRWEFRTDDSDIAFGVYHKQGDQITEYVPRDRVDSHIALEDGEVTCDLPGLYIVEFDNSYSYLRSKKVWYSVSITPPEAITKNGSSDSD